MRAEPLSSGPGWDCGDSYACVGCWVGVEPSGGQPESKRTPKAHIADFPTESVYIAARRTSSAASGEPAADAWTFMGEVAGLTTTSGGRAKHSKRRLFDLRPRQRLATLPGRDGLSLDYGGFDGLGLAYTFEPSVAEPLRAGTSYQSSSPTPRPSPAPSSTTRAAPRAHPRCACSWTSPGSWPRPRSGPGEGAEKGLLPRRQLRVQSPVLRPSRPQAYRCAALPLLACSI